MKILFGVSGSIATFKACTVVSQLAQQGHEVQVVATSSALKFVGEATFEGLTGRKVLTQVFESGQMMAHIDLTRWADVFVICPASANTLNSMAAGLGQDLLQSLVLAWDFKKTQMVFPAMNHQMWAHPKTQKSIVELKSWGVQIFEPGHGTQACGEVGVGRLLEPEEILNIISKSKIKSELRSVAITCGGTSEPIDSVRTISNFSSGQTGVQMAKEFLENGWRVYMFHSENVNFEALKGFGELLPIKYSSTKDLQHKLFLALKQSKPEALIHLAAVSDYIVSRPAAGKIESGIEKLTVELKPNIKLVDLIKKQFPKIPIVAFKLTDGADQKTLQQKVKALFENAQAHLVVHNDVQDYEKNRDQRLFKIFDPKMKLKEVKSVEKMAADVFRFIEKEVTL